ncbi:hypothetical protein [Microbacterium sp.]|uniref:hypothetical protein n=1 Tax=Microbacterium sp. TaxID=51671 RepID=UPI003C74BA20
MPRPLSPLPPELGRAYSVHRARLLGVTPRRLRGNDLDSPYWGVRTAPFASPDEDGLADRAALEHLHRMRAYAERMPETRFFIGLSALVVWCGLLPVAAPRLEVGVFAPYRAPHAQGVRGRQLTPGLVTVREHGGLRLSSPASTWVLLAASLPRRDLVTFGALLITPPIGPGGRVTGPALTSLTMLRAAIDAGPRRGVVAARRALELIRPGARSRTEVHLWLALVDEGLPEAQFNVAVYDEAGLIGVFDLAFVHLRVLVEFHGDYHRLSPAAWAADIAKRQRAREADWTVVEVTRRELYPDTAPAVARVGRALVARGLVL